MGKTRSKTVPARVLLARYREALEYIKERYPRETHLDGCRGCDNCICDKIAALRALDDTVREP